MRVSSPRRFAIFAGASGLVPSRSPLAKWMRTTPDASGGSTLKHPNRR